MTKVPFKPQFGAFVLETLTLGMYGESRNALREYIQNSFDSLQQAIADGLVAAADARVEITLDADGSGLTIRDNGVGLRTDNAVAVLASIGASNKDYRRNAGFRGIGRLAGVVFCNKLTFTTKAEGQVQQTVVVFDAEALRARLAPGGVYAGNAADTLESCVEASVEDGADIDAHFFEVRLSGFHNPPVECVDPTLLRIFLSQVSPLPYPTNFPFRDEIMRNAAKAGFQIESVRAFLRHGCGPFIELFKPYGDKFSVGSVRVPLSGIDEVRSPTHRWWGWVGRKRTSGLFKQQDERGIRVRVRNIQIDDTRILRDVFANSRRESGEQRISYARLADWYVGEIFVDPKSAIPNARRDGFEEDVEWGSIRAELEVAVAGRYGRLAYRTSQEHQLSIEKLNSRLANFSRTAEALIAQPQPGWDAVSLSMLEADDMQRRVSLAVKVAEEEELAPLRAIADAVSTLKSRMDLLEVRGSPARGCEEEIAKAVSNLTQRLYKALRLRLAPQEWQRARSIVREVSGEDVA